MCAIPPRAERRKIYAALYYYLYKNSTGVTQRLAKRLGVSYNALSDTPDSPSSKEHMLAARLASALADLATETKPLGLTKKTTEVLTKQITSSSKLRLLYAFQKESAKWDGS